jgi:hypothetical protein
MADKQFPTTWEWRHDRQINQVVEGDLPELCDAPDGTEPHAFPDGHGFLKSIVF